ncbi:MAG: PAS domain-containing sensor histidine kinase [Ignavibacteriae bacterium]|nr:MAG: PAS domain-containing sensor histidine kinase [Ignavibacteriota bacterium]
MNAMDLVDTIIKTEFQNFLNSAPDAMVIVNESGNILFINSQAEKLFGYKPAELIHQKVEILMPQEFRKKHISHRASFFKELGARPMGAGLELFGSRKDGTKFPVEISLSPIETQEGTIISAAIRDITDRKNEEQKFIGLLDSAPDAMVIVNDKGVMQLINKQAERIFGYKREELIGKKVEVLIPQEFHKVHTQHREEYFDTPRVRPMGAGLELFGARKDGTKFPVEISLSPLGTSKGILISAAIRDITIRKKTENDLLDLNKSLIEINRELESFSYSISHDLRAPLRHIIGFSNKLAKLLSNRLDEESTRVLNKISESATNMSMLMDELLKFTRIGRTELAVNRLNLNNLVTSVKDNLIKGLNSRKVTWKISDLPHVYADNNLLIIVLNNLISNALKFSNMREQTEIEINCTENEEEFIFNIKDNGIGFDDQYKGNLFGVFKRLHADDEFTGIGIGLAFVKRIIQRHGGKVWAQGEIDKGATFYFTLPKNKKGDLWKI